MDTMETKFSTPSKLVDLEEVIDTRTPVWDIYGSGDVRIKLDTDVNDQEWYVLSDDRSKEPLYGKVECWAFPHFNGAHDQYSYEPVAFCFKTFAELLEAYPTERAIWAYDEDEYAGRLTHPPDLEALFGDPTVTGEDITQDYEVPFPENVERNRQKDEEDKRRGFNTLLGDIGIDL